MGDDEDRPLRAIGRAVAADMVGQRVDEKRPRAGRDVIATLATGVGQLRGIGHPALPVRRVARLDLLVGQALPVAVVHLREAGVDLDRRSSGIGAGGAGRDQRRGLAGTHERTRDDALERNRAQTRREGGGLGAAVLGQPDVDLLTEVLLGNRARRQAVTGQDQGEHRAPV